MIDDSYSAVKNDFITALRIIYREGLSDAFAHLSLRSNDGNEMMFMPRKSPALVQSEELFFVDFDKPVPQSSLHQAIYKTPPDVKAVFHFHSPAVILLSVVGQTIRPMHNYSAIFTKACRSIPEQGKSNRRRGPERWPSCWAAPKRCCCADTVPWSSGNRFARFACWRCF